jgi:hypothetical protein
MNEKIETSKNSISLFKDKIMQEVHKINSKVAETDSSFDKYK